MKTYCRFVYDILHGVDIINHAFAKNGGMFGGGASKDLQAVAAEQSQGPPPEILIHLTNAGIVLPASSKSVSAQHYLHLLCC